MGSVLVIVVFITSSERLAKGVLATIEERKLENIGKSGKGLAPPNGWRLVWGRQPDETIFRSGDCVRAEIGKKVWTGLRASDWIGCLWLVRSSLLAAAATNWLRKKPLWRG